MIRNIKNKVCLISKGMKILNLFLKLRIQILIRRRLISTYIWRELTKNLNQWIIMTNFKTANSLKGDLEMDNKELVKHMNNLDGILINR